MVRHGLARGGEGSGSIEGFGAVLYFQGSPREPRSTLYRRSCGRATGSLAARLSPPRSWMRSAPRPRRSLG